MHSRRMRTVRSSGRRGGGRVSQHALGRGCVCLGGGVARRVLSAQGGVCPGGGVSAWGGGVCPIACWDTPPVDRMTDACENITLRTVIIQQRSISYISFRSILIHPRSTSYNFFYKKNAFQ